MTDTPKTLRPNQQLSTLETIPLTFKLIGSELRWSVLRSLRSIEIRQMEKRLQKEYQKLGELSAAKDRGDTSEVELCQKQIDFLEKELQFLKQELTNLRKDLVANRCRKWGLISEDSHTPEEDSAPEAH